jgi:GT2 family glycosyltransferase
LVTTEQSVSDLSRLSVVVPAHNAAGFFPRTLQALLDSSLRNCEIVVVDDHSTDETTEIASGLGVRVVPHNGAPCPGLARNTGVAATSGDIIAFIDADVLVNPQTLEQLRDAFLLRPEIAAVFGAYDDSPEDPGLVSQFKNLFHHFVHHQGSPDASTFWAGCGAVRRSAFEALGGFREHSLACVEDIDLGQRMKSVGDRIWLKPDIQAKHLKHWSLGNLIKTDVIVRGIPWTIMMKQCAGDYADLNFTFGHKVAAMAACVMLPLWMGAIVVVVTAATATMTATAATTVASHWLFYPLLLSALLNTLLFFMLTRKWYGFLIKKRGWFFAVRSVPVHLIYYHYCVAAWVVGNVLYHVKYRGKAGGS